MPNDDEQPLAGGWQTEVSTRDGLVLRAPKPQSRSVLTLLRHLEAVGYDFAPKVAGDGFAPDGRETLTFVEGQVPHGGRVGWSDDALHLLGAKLAQLHAATSDFAVRLGTSWGAGWLSQLPADELVVGHGDPGSWNVVARDGLPVALIDWDDAGPMDPLWDLAYAAWTNIGLYDNDVAERQQLGDAAERGRRLGVLLDGYALPLDRRPAFVGRIAELAIHAARREAVIANVGETTPAIDERGFPVLWAIAWRARSAAWILTNRTTLERAAAASRP